MPELLKRVVSGFVGLLLVSGLLLSGCSKHPSEEDLRVLNETKEAALAAEKQLAEKQRTKAQLESDLAKKKRELDAAKQEREAVKQRLEAMEQD